MNPQQIAIRRWYAANLVTQLPVGNNPNDVAFDGENVWVANNGDNSVTKLRASDCAILGTFPVGDGPLALAFDGANIWVANHNSNNVTKLKASDGTVVSTFAVGSDPAGIAFDGSNIWVVNHLDNTVTKLRELMELHLGRSRLGGSRKGLHSTELTFGSPTLRRTM